MFKNFYSGIRVFTVLLTMAMMLTAYVFIPDDELILYTIDQNEAEGIDGTNPSFTIEHSFTITYAAVKFSARVSNPFPEAELWFLNEKGEQTPFGTIKSETGKFNTEAVYSNKINISIPAGTYTVYTDDNTSWKINKEGFYQVIIKGYKN